MGGKICSCGRTQTKDTETIISNILDQTNLTSLTLPALEYRILELTDEDGCIHRTQTTAIFEILFENTEKNPYMLYHQNFFKEIFIWDLKKHLNIYFLLLCIYPILDTSGSSVKEFHTLFLAASGSDSLLYKDLRDVLTSVVEILTWGVTNSFTMTAFYNNDEIKDELNFLRQDVFSLDRVRSFLNAYVFKDMEKLYKESDPVDYEAFYYFIKEKHYIFDYRELRHIIINDF